MPFRKPANIDLDLYRDARTEAERVALWKGAMDLVGEATVVKERPFNGRLNAYAINEVRFVRIQSDSFYFSRTKQAAQQIRPDHLVVNLVESGRFSGTLAQRKVEVGPGDIVLSRLSDPMNLQIEDAVWMGLFFPCELIERFASFPRAFGGRVYNCKTPEAILFGGFMASIASLGAGLPRAQAGRVMYSAVALASACFGRQRVSEFPKDRSGDDLRRAIRRFISENLSNPDLGPDLISAEFNISRSKVYRVVEERTDIANIIRKLRLHRVHRDIVDGPISTPFALIAKRWGFNDERSFRRAFVKEFGHPPSLVRRQRAANAGYKAQDADVIKGALEQWLIGY